MHAVQESRIVIIIVVSSIHQRERRESKQKTNTTNTTVRINKKSTNYLQSLDSRPSTTPAPHTTIFLRSSNNEFIVSLPAFDKEVPSVS